MTPYAAVIFDMDGVLIDSEPIHHAVLNRVLDAEGLTIGDHEYLQLLGLTTAAMFETLTARYTLRGSVGEHGDRYEDALLQAFVEPRAPSAGVVALIARLRELGLRLGVASSSRRTWIHATLRCLGLSTAFDTLVSGDDVEHGKPDPAIYLLAAERLGVESARCLAIEDSPSGVQSARAAGMAVLGVRTPYTAHVQLDGVQRTVGSLTELDLAGEVFW